MANESNTLKAKVTSRLVKYAEGVTEDEIRQGLAEPIEVIESEEVIEFSKE
jgi:hypothetical protein